MSSQVEICNIWRNPNGLLQSFFLQVQWNRCSYLFETGSNAGFGSWSLYGFQSKEKKMKNRPTKLNRDKFPYSALRGKQLGQRLDVCQSAGEKMGAVHQSGDSAMNKTIRPLPSNGSARSIISAGPGDGCRNAVIDGSVCPSNLSADKEGLNDHERNEDRRPRRRTPPHAACAPTSRRVS